MNIQLTQTEHNNTVIKFWTESRLGMHYTNRDNAVRVAKHRFDDPDNVRVDTIGESVYLHGYLDGDYEQIVIAQQQLFVD